MRKKRNQMTSLIAIFLVVLAGVTVFSLLVRPADKCAGDCGNGACDPCESEVSCPKDCMSVNSARQAAVDFILRNVNYAEFNGKNLAETGVERTSTGFEFSYFFETEDESISGFNVSVSVSGGNVLKSEFREILKEPFCGRSSMSSCSSDIDCVAGGCSGQTCQARADEPSMTTCEFRECYDADNYGLECKCYEGRCQWI